MCLSVFFASTFPFSLVVVVVLLVITIFFLQIYYPSRLVVRCPRRLRLSNDSASSSWSPERRLQPQNRDQNPVRFGRALTAPGLATSRRCKHRARDMEKEAAAAVVVVPMMMLMTIALWRWVEEVVLVMVSGDEQKRGIKWTSHEGRWKRMVEY